MSVTSVKAGEAIKEGVKAATSIAENTVKAMEVPQVLYGPAPPTPTDVVEELELEEGILQEQDLYGPPPMPDPNTRPGLEEAEAIVHHIQGEQFVYGPAPEEVVQEVQGEQFIYGPGPAPVVGLEEEILQEQDLYGPPPMPDPNTRPGLEEAEAIVHHIQGEQFVYGPGPAPQVVMHEVQNEQFIYGPGPAPQVGTVNKDKEK